MGAGIIESEHACKEDNIFAIEFHVGGIDLEVVGVGGEALVERFRRVHSAVFGVGGTCEDGICHGGVGVAFEGVFGRTLRGRVEFLGRHVRVCESGGWGSLELRFPWS